MWFEQLAGFREDEVDRVADRFRIDGTTLTSLANGRTFTCGTFEPASLGELRTRADRVVSGRDQAGTTLTVREVVADVQQLHRDPVNAGGHRLDVAIVSHGRHNPALASLQHHLHVD